MLKVTIELWPHGNAERASTIATGFIAFFLVSLTVGVRLLLLWRRTRQLPELLIGIGVLGIGPVGFGLQMAGAVRMQAGHDPELLFLLGYFAAGCGVIAS